RGVVCPGWSGGAGNSRPAAGDAIDTVRAGEFGCELVEAVGVVVSASEQDQGSTGAAPVHDFKLDVLLDSNELDGVRSPIPTPRRFLGCALQVKRASRTLRRRSFQRVL